MIRVRLVVTGDVEEVALGDALKQLFPNLECSTVRKDAGNSNRLSRAPKYARREFVQFVDEMVACGMVERVPGGQPFDDVVVVDDLELANVDQPHVALDHLRLAVESRVAEIPKTIPTMPKGRNKNWPYQNDDTGRRAYLRERCSYHLVSPMIESLFFGESRAVAGGDEKTWSALERAGTQRLPIFDANSVDIERFVTEDPDFIASHPRWATHPLADPTWRALHPKHYVTFLCDPGGTQWRPYKEKIGGKAALAEIHWESVVTPPGHAGLVRALLDDFAEIAGVHLPWLEGGRLHPLTCRKSNGILRNIALGNCGPDH